MDAVAFVQYIAPGFLLVKAFQLFGAERARSEFEWTAWSVLAAVFIGELTASVPLRLLAGLGFGLVLAGLWRMLFWSRAPFAGWLTSNLTNSAWDLVLEHARTNSLKLEVATVRGDQEVMFYGTLGHWSYEQYSKDNFWVQLSDVYEAKGDSEYEPLDGSTDSILIPRSEIKLIRFANKVE